MSKKDDTSIKIKSDSYVNKTIHCIQGFGTTGVIIKFTDGSSIELEIVAKLYGIKSEITAGYYAIEQVDINDEFQ